MYEFVDSFRLKMQASLFFSTVQGLRTSTHNELP